MGTQVTENFTENMESQIAMDEIRKAQSDLNSAFDFRRSINWEQEEGARMEDLVGAGELQRVAR